MSDRIPAKNDSQARGRYARFLQLSLSCVSRTVWITAPTPYGRRDTISLTPQEDPVRLRTRSGEVFHLSASQLFHFEDDSRYEGERKVSTDAYAYRLWPDRDRDGELLDWHWHPGPDGVSTCHLHLGRGLGTRDDLHKLHLPTARVSFESVVGFAIREMAVQPLREDWEEILFDSHTRFEKYRTWHGLDRA